jgi:lactate permease
MTAGLALLPPAVVLAAILGLRVSGLAAASLAAATAGLIWAAAPFLAVVDAQFYRAIADAALLTLVVAAMIAPGMLFVEATRRSKSPEAMQGLVSALRLPTPRAAILIAVGIGVLVESLTGSGVSLLVTLPLLLALVERRAAIGLALVGMSMMPYGALSLSGIIGAKLAGMPVADLTGWQALLSGAVFAALPCLCLAFVRPARIQDVGLAVATGGVAWFAIAAASWSVGIELAGVAGGLAVIAFLALFSDQTGLSNALRAPGLRPYGMLILAVIAQKLAIGWLTLLGLSPVLATGRVEFAILTSPGVALLVTTLLTAGRNLDGAVWRATAKRAWRPILTVALFMIAARLLVECGAIAALGAALAGLGRTGALFAVTLLGAISGFVTGSGVSGNALFMASAAAVGTSFGQTALFAALQSSAASHAAMASLPVASILLAALPARTNSDDRTALVLGLRLLGVALTVLTILAWLAGP